MLVVIIISGTIRKIYSYSPRLCFQSGSIQILFYLVVHRINKIDMTWGALGWESERATDGVDYIFLWCQLYRTISHKY